ncbi:hypothetical protein HELRODRAFT_166689 [Helobdella robusta]|uniref:Uncharacterized protein n=1 Tax=Helobdella robusta TaxID=6412 RepID=T1EYD3_HELRO|nr:hypothetical protein HELRODRAFT_166689 [Helobdella robusta]ESO11674.1 hypothetical protein HELRODRAFT_166689 [Helobdella robusta]
MDYIRLYQFESFDKLKQNMLPKLKPNETEEFMRIAAMCPNDWTCVDSDRYLIVIGSDDGTLRVCDKRTGSRKAVILRASDLRMTKAMVINVGDDLVVTGFVDGRVSIARFYDQSQPGNGDIMLTDILGEHRQAITCLEWSADEYKLFSGDAKGVVLAHEVNVNLLKVESSVLFMETSSIIQLSYADMHLLTVTKHRAIIYSFVDSTYKIVGEENSEIKKKTIFGGLFSKDSQTNELFIYIVAEGLQIFKARMDGSIKCSYSFTDELIKDKFKNIFILESQPQSSNDVLTSSTLTTSSDKNIKVTSNINIPCNIVELNLPIRLSLKDVLAFECDDLSASKPFGNDKTFTGFQQVKENVFLLHNRKGVFMLAVDGINKLPAYHACLVDGNAYIIQVAVNRIPSLEVYVLVGNANEKVIRLAADPIALQIEQPQPLNGSFMTATSLTLSKLKTKTSSTAMSLKEPMKLFKSRAFQMSEKFVDKVKVVGQTTLKNVKDKDSFVGKNISKGNDVLKQIFKSSHPDILARNSRPETLKKNDYGSFNRSTIPVVSRNLLDLQDVTEETENEKDDDPIVYESKKCYRKRKITVEGGESGSCQSLTYSTSIHPKSRTLTTTASTFGQVSGSNFNASLKNSLRGYSLMPYSPDAELPLLSSSSPSMSDASIIGHALTSQSRLTSSLSELNNDLNADKVSLLSLPAAICGKNISSCTERNAASARSTSATSAAFSTAAANTFENPTNDDDFANFSIVLNDSTTLSSQETTASRNANITSVGTTCTDTKLSSTLVPSSDEKTNDCLDENNDTKSTHADDSTSLMKLHQLELAASTSTVAPVDITVDLPVLSKDVKTVLQEKSNERTTEGVDAKFPIISSESSSSASLNKDHDVDRSPTVLPQFATSRICSDSGTTTTSTKTQSDAERKDYGIDLDLLKSDKKIDVKLLLANFNNGGPVTVEEPVERIPFWEIKTFPTSPNKTPTISTTSLEPVEVQNEHINKTSKEGEEKNGDNDKEDSFEDIYSKYGQKKAEVSDDEINPLKVRGSLKKGKNDFYDLVSRSYKDRDGNNFQIINSNPNDDFNIYFEDEIRNLERFNDSEIEHNLKVSDCDDSDESDNGDEDGSDDVEDDNDGDFCVISANDVTEGASQWSSVPPQQHSQLLSSSSSSPLLLISSSPSATPAILIDNSIFPNFFQAGTSQYRNPQTTVNLKNLNIDPLVILDEFTTALLRTQTEQIKLKNVELREFFRFTTAFPVGSFAVSGQRIYCISNRLGWLCTQRGNIRGNNVFKLRYNSPMDDSAKWLSFHPKVPIRAQQVSAYSGVIWRLLDGKAFAYFGHVTAEHTWTMFANDVAFIHVSNENCAFFVKKNGDLYVHRGVSRDRPCFEPLQILLGFPIVKVSHRDGVVWVLDRSESMSAFELVFEEKSDGEYGGSGNDSSSGYDEDGCFRSHVIAKANRLTKIKLDGRAFPETFELNTATMNTTTNRYTTSIVVNSAVSDYRSFVKRTLNINCESIIKLHNINNVKNKNLTNDHVIVAATSYYDNIKKRGAFSSNIQLMAPSLLHISAGEKSSSSNKNIRNNKKNYAASASSSSSSSTNKLTAEEEEIALHNSTHLLIPNKTTNINNTVFMLTNEGEVIFTHGITRSSPGGCGLWYNVCQTVKIFPTKKSSQGKNITENSSSLKCKENGDVVVCSRYYDGFVFMTLPIYGYRFESKWMSDSQGFDFYSIFKDMSVSSTSIWLLTWDNCITNMIMTCSFGSMFPVPHPPTETKISMLSASSQAVWCLTEDGAIYVANLCKEDASDDEKEDESDGASAGEPKEKKFKWRSMELSQLDSKSGRCRMKHISLGRSHVWAVDQSGSVYFRTSARYNSKGLNPAWILISNAFSPELDTVKFDKVFVSGDDSLVWALDTTGQIYVREGIKESLHIGSNWDSILGPKTHSLSLSGNFAYVVGSDHQVHIRVGITPKYPDGLFWVKIPKYEFSKIYTNCNDDVWTLDSSGELHHLDICRVQSLSALSSGSSSLADSSKSESKKSA